MTGPIRGRLIRVLKSMLCAFAEGSGARIHAMPHQHPAGPGREPPPSAVPDWHPERVVPLSELPEAEQRWWRHLERRLR